MSDNPMQTSKTDLEGGAPVAPAAITVQPGQEGPGDPIPNNPSPWRGDLCDCFCKCQYALSALPSVLEKELVRVLRIFHFTVCQE